MFVSLPLYGLPSIWSMSMIIGRPLCDVHPQMSQINGSIPHGKGNDVDSHAGHVGADADHDLDGKLDQRRNSEQVVGETHQEEGEPEEGEGHSDIVIVGIFRQEGGGKNAGGEGPSQGEAADSQDRGVLDFSYAVSFVGSFLKGPGFADQHDQKEGHSEDAETDD